MKPFYNPSLPYTIISESIEGFVNCFRFTIYLKRETINKITFKVLTFKWWEYFGGFGR